jgi:hypothetical protein
VLGDTEELPRRWGWLPVAIETMRPGRASWPRPQQAQSQNKAAVDPFRKGGRVPGGARLHREVGRPDRGTPGSHQSCETGRCQLTVNLIGGPALAPRDFGANRWSFKPELGFSRTQGRWYLELYGGVWIFGTNGDFYGGSNREQDPLGAFQAHVSYTFKPRLWLAADATFYTGGRTAVDGVAKADLQRNSRLGAALAPGGT